MLMLPACFNISIGHLLCPLLRLMSLPCMWDCRVRCEAAMALATTASSDTEFAGFQVLLKMFRTRCHTSSSTAEQQSQIGQGQSGSNVGEYLVNEALPLAIASVRDDGGHSPPEAAEVLVSIRPNHMCSSSG